VNKIADGNLTDEQILEREEEAYNILFDNGKLEHYMGRYVAILNGRIIGDNEDELSLMEAAYDEYGYRTIYVRKVEEGREKRMDNLGLIRMQFDSLPAKRD